MIPYSSGNRRDVFRSIQVQTGKRNNVVCKLTSSLTRTEFSPKQAPSNFAFNVEIIGRNFEELESPDRSTSSPKSPQHGSHEKLNTSPNLLEGSILFNIFVIACEVCLNVVKKHFERLEDIL